MTSFRLDFEAAIIEEQRPLSGRRSVAIEGMAQAATGTWTLTLSFEQPKESGEPIDEGELTLAGPRGAIYGSLEVGRVGVEVDEITLAEQESLDLRFDVRDGDGAFAASEGHIRLSGSLTTGQGHLIADVQVEGAAGSAADAQKGKP